MAAKVKKAAAKPADEEKKAPMTRADFWSKAKQVELSINGQNLLIPLKDFATGSFGWFENTKVIVKVGDTPVKVQCNLQLTVVNSKLAPDAVATNGKS